MASPTTILNLALLEIGSNEVTDINDTDTDAARRGLLLFEDTVKKCMVRIRPNCCTKSAVLTRNTAAPAVHWLYSYTMPTQCLKITQMNGYEEWEREPYWVVQGRDILTDEETVKITYIEYTEDTSVFDPELVDCIVLLLASKLAIAVGGDRQMAKDLRAEWDAEWPMASANSGNEGSKPKKRNWHYSNYVASRRWPIGRD